LVLEPVKNRLCQEQNNINDFNIDNSIEAHSISLKTRRRKQMTQNSLRTVRYKGSQKINNELNITTSNENNVILPLSKVRI
jgi:hypothetical protein